MLRDGWKLTTRRDDGFLWVTLETAEGERHGRRFDWGNEADAQVLAAASVHFNRAERLRDQAHAAGENRWLPSAAKRAEIEAAWVDVICAVFPDLREKVSA